MRGDGRGVKCPGAPEKVRGAKGQIRNMFQDVREITKFINDSCVRREMFSQTNSESGDTRSLKILCDTRFIERHDALITFSNQLERIFECLEQIAASNSSRETTDRARSFMKKLLDSEFLISLACAKKVVSLTINVSRSLQTINKDLLDAILYHLFVFHLYALQILK
jgi:hypothetical protein